MDFIGYGAIFFAGLAIGLFGGGGSILTVPILVYIFSIAPAMATVYSLFVVGVVACVGAVRLAKQNLVVFRVGLYLGGPAIVGVGLARRFILPNLPEVVFNFGQLTVTKDSFIMLVFSLVMGAAAISMFHKREGGGLLNQQEETTSWVLIPGGLLIGVVTGFVGAGGGFLLVPVLNNWVGLPIKRAIGTSMMIIFMKCLLGFLMDGQAMMTDWLFMGKILLSALSGMFVGTWFGQRIAGATLRPLFGWGIASVTVLILVRELLGVMEY
ncbi:MAG: sulfite exporter TauE/SafE family protein [Myxococcota bacterium]|nr:sulfite exporter TauE/SafE family protein [Myxococcota bacterium]